MIIIGSWEELNIGLIYPGVYTRLNKEKYQVNFFVHREASYNEWIEYRKKENINMPPENGHKVAFFYAVTTD